MLNKTIASILFTIYLTFVPMHAQYRGFNLPPEERTAAYSEGHHKMFPAKSFNQNELVFFSLEFNDFKYGTVVEHVENDIYAIKSIASNKIYHISDTNMRALAPLWKTIYQPNVDLELFHQSLLTVLDDLKASDYPFILSTIPNSETQLIVVGDLHGCRSSMAYLFEKWYQLGILKDNLEIAPGYKIIFLGDYADRINEGIETYYMLLELKSCNGDDVILCRGNHEDDEMARIHGFMNEWLDKFGEDEESKASWQSMKSLFKCLPHCVCINYAHQNAYSTILFSHGGVEPIQGLLKTILCIHQQKSAQQVTFKLDFLEQDNNFNWLDFFAPRQDKNYKFNQPSSRGSDLQEWSKEAFARYATTQVGQTGSPEFHFKLHAIIRAHQHEVGSAAKLRSTEKNNSSWKIFTNEQPYTIKRYDVITQICAPEMLAPFGIPQADTFSIVRYNNCSGWTYTPYIRLRQ